MSSPPPKPLIFYDIAMAPPVEKTCCSPNPWKTRLALNFKNLPYTTSWTPLPDVAKLRRSLQVPACRKFADGTDFYTLPIISDPNTGSVIGDSFDIAVYLQNTYPDLPAARRGEGDLFPPAAHRKITNYVFQQDPARVVVPLTECRDSPFPEYARFNVNVDAAFTAHSQLSVQEFPFDPATAEISKKEFARRAGVSSWDDFTLVGEARDKLKDSFRETLGGLAKVFSRDADGDEVEEGTDAHAGAGGPFVLGTRACYADLIVGGWLRMMRATLPKSEWEEVRSWHGGLFGRLHDALEVYAEVQ